MSLAPLLSLHDVACLRGGRLLFERVSLRLGGGGALLLAGPNGAGKSSMIRICAGLLPPSAGAVRRTTACALADEGLALDDRLTLGAALRFWSRLDGRDAEIGLDAMGLTDLSALPVRMLSTGQRKRAVLARLIASGAPLWLLDEPANGLDAEGEQRLAAAITEHRRNGGALIVASHQPLPLPEADTLPLGRL